MTHRHIDLSHPIIEHMTTYPGLPGPTVRTHLSRKAAEAAYGPGVTFHIAIVEICTNTGTYLDVPFHRFADGHDLTELDLARIAAVPAVCLDRSGETAISLDALGPRGFSFTAVPPKIRGAGTFTVRSYATLA